MSSSAYFVNYPGSVLTGYTVSALSLIFIIYVTAEGWLW